MPMYIFRIVYIVEVPEERAGEENSLVECHIQLTATLLSPCAVPQIQLGRG